MNNSEICRELDELGSSGTRAVIVGIGSELMSDDAAGVLTVRKIKSKLLKYTSLKDNLLLLEGCGAPENFSGEIKQFKPTHVIYIDAVDMREKPGSILSIDPAVIDGVTFSTHTLPLSVLSGYIVKETESRQIFIGIQCGHVKFGSEISPAVKAAISKLSAVILDSICGCD